MHKQDFKNAVFGCCRPVVAGFPQNCVKDFPKPCTIGSRTIIILFYPHLNRFRSLLKAFYARPKPDKMHTSLLQRQQSHDAALFTKITRRARKMARSATIDKSIKKDSKLNLGARLTERANPSTSSLFPNSYHFALDDTAATPFCISETSSASFALPERTRPLQTLAVPQIVHHSSSPMRWPPGPMPAMSLSGQEQSLLFSAFLLGAAHVLHAASPSLKR